MLPLIFLTLCTTLCQSNHQTIESTPETTAHQAQKFPALIYDLDDSQLDKENISCLIACPASTREEKQFNDEVSITGFGLFVQNINSSGENDTLDVCDRPLQPAMVYDSEHDTYDIGYELYYTKGKAKLGTANYSIYRAVNQNNEIINSTKPPSLLAVEYQDDECTNFFIANKSSTLIFHWKMELYFIHSRYDNTIQIETENVKVPYDRLRFKCEDYTILPQVDKEIYVSFEKNSKEILKSASPDGKPLKEWNSGQSYGTLVMSQIIPLWYFNTYSAKLASCTHINMIPVWKTIAEGQLRKVDLYLQATIHELENFQAFRGGYWKIKRVIFGVSDALSLHPESSHDLNSKKILFSTADSLHRQFIPVPKIIYRIIEGGYHDSVFSAVIVIHNDPNNVSNSDRICPEEDEVRGWEGIKNNNVETGLTYVCPYRVKKIIHDKLAIHTDNTDGEPLHPLELSAVHYLHTSGGYRSSVIASTSDVRYSIKHNFMQIMKILS